LLGYLYVTTFYSSSLNSFLESKELQYDSLHHWERELKQEFKMTFKKNWQKKEKQAACSNSILDISDYYFPYFFENKLISVDVFVQLI
jgi:hypothetical protein